MYKILLILIFIAALIGCSKEESVEACNCEKITSRYIQSLQVYEEISREQYGKDCSAHKPVYNPDGDGNYYMIQCK